VDGDKFKLLHEESVAARLERIENEVALLKKHVEKVSSPEQIRTAVARSRVSHD
jgi:hypothetical protein